MFGIIALFKVVVDDLRQWVSRRKTTQSDGPIQGDIGTLFLLIADRFK